ncbi:pilus assembly protein [Legionella sp. CNM-4043-24]|uniref:pilus assembly protein n=1 Tax=Legionella sp. CNM-4043-24 TaxID=3421646 RepID=UPI00403A887D
MKHALWALGLAGSILSNAVFSAPLNLSQIPLFISQAVAPLTMLVLSRDGSLYFEAYNDSTDLNNDGVINTRFTPGINYYGYFDSNKCYQYDSTQQYFYPVSITADKKCPGKWSGLFLNYVTTARFDAIRKVLYGGLRSVDTTTATVLQRTYIPQEGHSWGKEYQSLAVDGFNISDYTPLSAPSSGRYLLFANTTLRNGTANPLLRVAPNQPYRIWEWVSIERPVAGSKALHGTDGTTMSNITDYVVRVKVCDPAVGLEDNCQIYPNGQYKPIGLLQEYGENDAMQFGLLTGSYANSLQGGVLRKNISSITDEINLKTGQFTSVNGIISTLNKLTVTNLGTDYVYANCGFITTRNIVNGECEMWGNPVAEMLYETIRYLAGKTTPTAAFDYSTGLDVTLGLPKPAWVDPYKVYPYCSKANILLLSDLYPTYDSNYVPGSYFNSFTGDLTPSLNAASLAKTIFDGEGFSSVLAFIGQSGAVNDGAPTPKTVTSFGDIRGLAPQDTNSEGSYYSASVAYYGWINDLNPAQGVQNVKSYIVALSSPKPEIKFVVGGNPITIVPFGKSVSGFSIDSTKGAYQPNNEIVDFYIESLTPTGGVFRVNFADLQQGGDFDMDAIVKYTITVNANNTITVQTDSIYAAGSMSQHMGYVISGTTNDGLYLEVRDVDTTSSSDVDYFLDTPPGVLPGGTWKDKKPLPLTATRTFSPSSTPSAITLKSPLWYAAKWGGFNDSNGNSKPDDTKEFDADGDGTPDNYFLVSNATFLRSQLAKAFQQIIDRSGSFASASLNSSFLTSTTALYQSIFRTKDWSGQLLSYKIDPTNGDILYTGTGPNGSTWDASERLNTQNYSTGRRILTYKPSKKIGIRFKWPSNPLLPGTSELDLTQVNALNTNPQTGVSDSLGSARLDYIRGNKAQEVSRGGTFRNRTYLLGDIINSSPLIIGAPNQAYPSSWSGSAPENSAPYSTFQAANINRTEVVYVGANDGMLHAFDAVSGNELFAYVPSSVFPNLNQLTNPAYTHQFYVDGSPNVVDVFASSNQWMTVLVGTLQAGGQGVFALDVTDPSAISEATAASVVKWEFTDRDDADVGFVYGQASIVRLANGQWAAIFGNGYNNTVADGYASTTGNAVIYIVDINTGALIKKFDTKVGMLADPLLLGRPNGMASPVVVDRDGNSIADTIYAGDLFGNLWKIDISSSSVSNWDFSYRQSTNPAPLFVATDSNGKRQPITSRPAVSKIKTNPSGLQLYFGTGKYLEAGDKTDKSIQTVYSIQDNNTTPIAGRGELLQQVILAETSTQRATSNYLMANNQRGWYMDLTFNNQALGERIISNIIFRSDKIIFATIIPSDNPCDFGGTSWLMELNALNGSRLNYNVFDSNEDGLFDNNDGITFSQNGQNITVPASGLKPRNGGLMGTPPIINAGSKEYKYMTGTSGGIQKIGENPGPQIFGRQSWRQLQ